MLRMIAFNLLQVLVVLFLSPLVVGILNRLKERMAGKQGPSVWQLYRDIFKLMGKDRVISSHSTWVFRFAPYVIFASPILVTLLIPVLTTYPLFFAFMGDMLGGGFVLALGGFFYGMAAIDTANPYGAMGASRTRMVGFLGEPVFMTVFFTVCFVANSTIPYIVQQRWLHPAGNFFAPAHLLICVAFFMLILAETGKIPVDNPSGHFELAMIDESKALEYSGPSMALIKWGGAMKFVVLLCILLNVLIAPWGLASGHGFLDVLSAIPLIFIKMLAAVVVIVIVETALAKLRLFRITGFLGLAFVIAVTALLTRML